MNDDDEIVDLDADLDLDHITPENLLDSLGLSAMETEDLLQLLKNGAQEATEAFGSGLFQKGPKGMEAYHGIGMRYAPIAFAIYERLLKIGEEPRLPAFLAVNRSRSSGCSPNMVLFWADPDAITGLYESLEKDGYYEKMEISF